MKNSDQILKMIVEETQRGMRRKFHDALKAVITDKSPTISPTHFTVYGTPEEFIEDVMKVLNS